MKNTSTIPADTVLFLGVEYTREQINAMREWAKYCQWSETFEESRVNNLPDITILRGIHLHSDGGLPAFTDHLTWK